MKQIDHDMSIAMVIKAKEAILHHYITACLLAVVVTHARQARNQSKCDRQNEIISRAIIYDRQNDSLIN